ncbi:hypothetical protein HispidOSU_009119, partial [Sigmodon hispidus]
MLLSFRLILHRYEIIFALTPVRRLSKNIIEAPIHSLHLKRLSATPIPEGYSIKCEYSAQRGRPQREMQLACESDTGIW